MKDGVVPYQSSYVGIELFGQAAWRDSQTGALKLSIAAHIKVPALPTFADSLDAKRLVANHPTNTSGWVTHAPFANPIIRYD